MRATHRPRPTDRTVWCWLAVVTVSALAAAGCADEPSPLETIIADEPSPLETIIADEPSPLETIIADAPELDASTSAASAPGGSGAKGPEPAAGVSTTTTSGASTTTSAVTTTTLSAELRHWWPTIWESAGLAGKVLDLCDDLDALAATGRVQPPGHVLSDHEKERVANKRAVWGVTCPRGPGAGPVHLLVLSRGPHRLMEPAAAAAHAATTTTVKTRGWMMGYEGPDFEVSAPSDEVVVLTATVKAKDGALRGLVQNKSATKWARNLAVSANGKTWNYPLSVQPGEVAPFELDGWAGLETDPDKITFNVTAALTDTIDITRALVPMVSNRNIGMFDAAEHTSWEPAFQGDTRPTGDIYIYEQIWEIRAPKSHPHLADQVNSQAIKHLRLFTAFLDHDGKVNDILDLYHDPYPKEAHADGFTTGGITFAQYTRNPYNDDDLHIIWAGGATGPRPKPGTSTTQPISLPEAPS